MLKIRFIRDLDACRRLWKQFIRPVNLSDLWEFRICFQNHYQHSPCFILLEDEAGIAGMLPLSYLRREERFIFFPGETWHGRSWLERTPYYLRESRFIADLFQACPDNTCLRYLEPSTELADSSLKPDEMSYLLFPQQMQFCFDTYLCRFATKRLKAIQREIQSILQPGWEAKIDRLVDFDTMVRWNLNRFDSESYFVDPRFRESFRDVMGYLHRQGWLRMTSLIIGNETAAIDLGAVYNRTYTVFVGGTHSGYPGVAKAINMHHLKFAFNRQMAKVDFLCGDFFWKKLWHLDEVPLFQFDTTDLAQHIPWLMPADDYAKAVPRGRHYH
jgi:hypothetical protein